MNDRSNSLIHSDDDSLHPLWTARLESWEAVFGLAGLVLATIHLGSRHPSEQFVLRLFAAGVVILAFFALSVGLRYRWSRTRKTFLQENIVPIASTATGLAGVLLVGLIGGWQSESTSSESMVWFEPANYLIVWIKLSLAARGFYEIYRVARWVGAAGWNPAFVLAMSFLVLILSGTLLLMLPRCRPDGMANASFREALFTSTSACCVTGLVIVDTGTYWSRFGQTVILLLIQMGGLGIMTFGAFVAVILGRKLPAREHATIRDLLESERLSDVGRLLRSILGFTLAIELSGAICLWTLWPDMPWSERVYCALFHSISAFCNAGFSLLPNGLMGLELHWQVGLAVPGLIILGGFGFMALQNWRDVFFNTIKRAYWPYHRIPLKRLTLTTRLVTLTTLGLLIGGSILLFLLEFNNPANPRPLTNQIMNAWFHSVTLRTAGFNTIDHSSINPASKLLGIALMFIGASPGSTGGGVKTVSLAMTVLVLRAVMRGREQVEAFDRTIPAQLVARGLVIIVVALLVLITVTLLLIVLEDQPDKTLDLMYEAMSALGTVGISSIGTHNLKPSSQYLLVLTMFLGRIGPLTLIIALAGRAPSASYSYPEERITLG